jgi:hypothetical protein
MEGEETHVNKRLFQVALACVALPGLACPLPAQTVRMTVDVPFEFQVGNSSLPAGRYVVASTASPELMEIRPSDGREGMYFVAIRSGGGSAPEGRSAVTYHRYGSRVFLHRIVAGWAATGFETPPNTVERELIRSAQRRVEVLPIIAMW